MKKKLLIIPSVLALFSLASCNPSNEGVNGSRNIVDILLNASDGYTFEDGKSSTYLHVHKDVTWGAIKDSAPKKVKDLSGNYYDVPSKDTSGNLKNYWVVGDETNPISDDYHFNNDKTTLTAHIVPSKNVTVTLNPKGGKWKGTTDVTPKKITIEQGTVWSTIKNDYKVEAPDSKTFVGFTDEDSETAQTIPDTYVFNADTNLYAKHVAEPTFVDFESDSWEVFNVALKAGTLHEKYGAGSFVGKKRKVTLWGVSYDVQVIGENADTIYGASDKVALTFQFVDAIETGIGFNNDMDNIYDTAAIRGYLNQSLFNQLPDEVKDNMKVVSKLAYDTDTNYVYEYPEKIFLPSFNEVGITEFECGGVHIDCQEEGFDDGSGNFNQPYAYYADSSTATSRRIKKYYDNPVTHLESESTVVDYWLRSVDFESTDSVYYIMSTGVAPTESSVDADIGLAIAPCFALGGNA